MFGPASPYHTCCVLSAWRGFQDLWDACVSSYSNSQESLMCGVRDWNRRIFLWWIQHLVILRSLCIQRCWFMIKTGICREMFKEPKSMLVELPIKICTDLLRQDFTVLPEKRSKLRLYHFSSLRILSHKGSLGHDFRWQFEGIQEISTADSEVLIAADQYRF